MRRYWRLCLILGLMLAGPVMILAQTQAGITGQVATPRVEWFPVHA